MNHPPVITIFTTWHVELPFPNGWFDVVCDIASATFHQIHGLTFASGRSILPHASLPPRGAYRLLADDAAEQFTVHDEHLRTPKDGLGGPGMRGKVV